ncbi:MAG: hypothetical protein ABJL72_18165 [Roseobacter sp.]
MLDQRRELAAQMDHWLDLFDRDLESLEYRPSKRPLHALMMLFQTGAAEIKAGDTLLSGEDDLAGNMEQMWFRVVFDAVEYWYLERYGEAVMQENGNDALVGAVSIRGVIRKVVVPLHRRKVEVEAEQSWMYFEDGLGEGEDAASMIVDAPDLRKLDEVSRNTVISEATLAAEVLRSINFRTVTFRSDGDQEVRKLIQSTSTYLQQAAVRMVSFHDNERGPAWFDLQMANEAAMKAVILSHKKSQPKIHSIERLIEAANHYGMNLEVKKFKHWPAFSDISDWRYGQGHPSSFADLYRAYQITLELVHACMGQFIPEMKSGFGLLIKYAPYKLKNAAGEFRG